MTLRCVNLLAIMASESDPLQLILAELASIKAGNEALQQTLAQQEAQHRSDLATL